MASEMINKVLEAEKKAAEREADAKAKAADIIKTAEAEAIYSKARAEVQGQIENLKQLGNDRRDVSAEAVLKTIIPQD